VGSFLRCAAISAPITLFAGDFLAADASLLASQPPNAAWDRGSLVALPLSARAVYAVRLLDLLPVGGRILLCAVEYNAPGESPGPPHSVSRSDVEELFGRRCSVEELSREADRDPSPKLLAAGAPQVWEVAYLLTIER
jgi:hypothetical protein